MPLARGTSDAELQAASFRPAYRSSLLEKTTAFELGMQVSTSLNSVEPMGARLPGKPCWKDDQPGKHLTFIAWKFLQSR